MWNNDQYQICHRCKGSGQDRDGADCLGCYGEGEIPLVS